MNADADSSKGKCKAKERVGLLCAEDGDAPLTMQVRLAGGGYDKSRGRVEVRVGDGGQWGTVCDDSWGRAESATVCRMLGWEGEGAESTLDFGPGSGLSMLVCKVGDIVIEVRI